MAVCQLVSGFRPVIGGEERTTETLSRSLIGAGTDVIVLTRRLDALVPAHEVIHGIPVFRAGLAGRGKVHVLSYALHSMWLLAWRFRRYGVVHAHNTDTPVLVGMLARVFLRRRLVVTVHGETQLLTSRGQRLRRFRHKLMARTAHAFTSMNPEVKDILIALGAKPSRIHEIPNGIDTDVFRPPSETERSEAREQLGIPAQTRIVAIYLGRLERWKRVDLLIDAWAALPRRDDSCLFVVGPGVQAKALKGQAESLGLDVRFEGPTDSAIRYYQAADVFVLPSGDEASNAYEGLSVALLESMAVGLAPVVSKCPGNDMLVTDGVTGLSFAIGDEAGLRERLASVIDDAAMRDRLGRAAHEFVVRDYSAESVAQKVIGLYAAIEPGR